MSIKITMDEDNNIQIPQQIIDLLEWSDEKELELDVRTDEGRILIKKPFKVNWNFNGFGGIMQTNEQVLPLRKQEPFNRYD